MYLLRSLSTEIVHRPECRAYGADCARWNWADNQSMEDVTAATAKYPWLHLCRKCLPGLCRCGRCGQ